MNTNHIDVWLERICQLIAVALSFTAAFYLRFEFAIPATLVPVFQHALLLAVLVKPPVFDGVGFYRGLRRFVSIPDLYLVFLGNVIGSLLFAVVTVAWLVPELPRS